MGTYTELWFRAYLEDDAPIDLIRNVVEGNNLDDSWQRPTHPLFDLPSWPLVVRGAGAMFPAQYGSRLVHEQGGWELSVHSSMKNYHSEIEAFVDWIDPYVMADPGEFLGYQISEYGMVPMLFHKREPS